MVWNVVAKALGNIMKTPDLDLLILEVSFDRESFPPNTYVANPAKDSD